MNKTEVCIYIFIDAPVMLNKAHLTPPEVIEMLLCV